MIVGRNGYEPSPVDSGMAPDDVEFLAGALLAAGALYVLALLFVPDPTGSLARALAGAGALVTGTAVSWYAVYGRDA